MVELKANVTSRHTLRTNTVILVDYIYVYTRKHQQSLQLNFILVFLLCIMKAGNLYFVHPWSKIPRFGWSKSMIVRWRNLVVWFEYSLLSRIYFNHRCLDYSISRLCIWPVNVGKSARRPLVLVKEVVDRGLSDLKVFAYQMKPGILGNLESPSLLHLFSNSSDEWFSALEKNPDRNRWFVELAFRAGSVINFPSCFIKKIPSLSIFSYAWCWSENVSL